jgi:cycloeucalenol cycloisomerase
MDAALKTPAGLAGLLSQQPTRRHVERYWLMFTPVWGLIAAAIMLTGVAEEWGDLELMIFGVAMMLAAVVPPTLWPHEEDRARPIVERTGFKMSAAVTAIALCMNYFCTPYFFDVLHMHYGFNTQINIQHNPVFLYFTTVAYFATYCVLLCAAYRGFRRVFSGPSRWIAGGVAALIVAFLETALNANPFMKSLFCFDDPQLMLTFGTFSYGTCFMFTLPLWLNIDEDGERTSLSRIGIHTAAAMMGIVVTFELLRHGVAPYVTEVVEDANGLRDFASSCLLSR